METHIKYSKPVLSRKEFIRESGYPAALVDRALHSKYADAYSFRTSDAPNAKTYIITAEFEYFRRNGDIR